MRPFSRRPDEDFSEEVKAHLELETERLIADGMTPDAARAAARKAFGNVAAAEERFHESTRWVWLEQFANDLRYAARGLRRSPAFLLTTVLTLAVGLALVTVVFTVFNAYVLRPFAIQDPDSLYSLGWRAGEDGGHQFRWKDYTALRERDDLFAGVIADHSRYSGSDGRTVAAAFVSTNYFDVLAPRTLMGRAISSVDDRQPVVVLSEQGWTRLFGKDPAVLGRQLDIDGRPFTVIGVIAAAFSGIDDLPRDFWAPLTARMESFNPERHIEISARLRPGVSAAHAQAALTTAVAGMVPPRNDGKTVRADVTPQSTANPLSFEMLAVLSPIFAAFGLVLLTACANVSNVMLSRAISRHREIAVRLSLGASRGRIVRQLVTEGLLITVLAGTVALALAAFTLRAGLAAVLGTLPPSFAMLVRVAPLGFDYRVFFFALVIALATTVVVALVPALQASRTALTDALRGQRTGTLRGSRLRGALVIAQVAVSLVLVVTAMTVTRNSTSVAALDPGFDTRGITSINVRGGDAEPLVARLAPVFDADPRVGAVAIASGNPFFTNSRIALSGGAGSEAMATRYTFVSPNYFRILRIPIVSGRLFDEREAAASAPVAVVSEATAKRFWPGQDAIGRTVAVQKPDGRPVDELPGYSQATVVGVVTDVISGMPIEGKDDGHVYFPTRAGNAHAAAVLLRARSERELGPAALQELFRRVSNDPQKFEALPLDEVRQVLIYPLRLASWVGVVLGGMAVALSISGLYGVLAYTVAHRTREIGIRMALGATGAAVVRLVMRQSARLAGTGIVVGLSIVFVALKTLSAVIQLREISLLDLAAFGGGVAVVAAAAALAAFQPARRATRVDPAETLRAEA
jgi:predicted permease